jgi:hypothetical protein
MPAGMGYNASADLLTATADGVDLNTLWADYQAALAQYNADRDRLVNFLSFPVSDPIEEVPIVGHGGAEFEEASEYGVPKSYRPEVDHYNFGYDFKWYDIASRYTWRFLSDAPQSQVDAIFNQAVEADNRLVYTRVFQRIFNPVNNLANIRGNAYNVYTFYNGTDIEPPPPYKSNVFDATHNHFLASGATTIDPGDLQDMIEHLAHHGYSKTNGYRVLGMFNKTETDVIRSFRLGTNGALYDFIPVQGTNPFFIPDTVTLQGTQPSANAVPGFNTVGSYGDMLIVEEDHIPTKYGLALASGGRDNVGNPVGFRQHANSSLRGMRLVKGRDADYPLIDSYYVRGFGTGVRHRGAGVVMQIATGPAYTPPANFVYAA